MLIVGAAESSVNDSAGLKLFGARNSMGVWSGASSLSPANETRARALARLVPRAPGSQPGARGEFLADPYERISSNFSFPLRTTFRQYAADHTLSAAPQPIFGSFPECEYLCSTSYGSAELSLDSSKA